MLPTPFLGRSLLHRLKDPSFLAIDEKSFDKGLIKFPGYCPFILSCYQEQALHSPLSLPLSTTIMLSPHKSEESGAPWKSRLHDTVMCAPAHDPTILHLKIVSLLFSLQFKIFRHCDTPSKSIFVLTIFDFDQLSLFGLIVATLPVLTTSTPLCYPSSSPLVDGKSIATPTHGFCHHVAMLVSIFFSLCPW